MNKMINIIEDIDKGIDMNELAPNPTIKEEKNDEQSK